MTTTEQKIKEYHKAAIEGTIADESNPAYLFSTVSASMMVKILEEGLDLREMLLLSLSERGLNEKGKWVGFKK